MTSAAAFTASPGLTIPDDGYAGGFGGAGQACSTIAVPTAVAVQEAWVDVNLTHTWVGDLTIKLRNPAGTILTILNRPGSNAPDDGSGAVGDSSNWSGSVQFRDGSPDTAETMGNTLTTDQVVCTNDGRCRYTASPDTATSPPNFASAFNGSSSATNWILCVSDSALGDVGTLNSWTLKIASAFLVPTASQVSVSGRVLTSVGSPVRGAVVKLGDPNGEEKFAISNPFGHYRFENISVGETYVIGVTAKNRAFAPHLVTVNDEITDLDLIADQ